jgi:hypothetical protein
MKRPGLWLFLAAAASIPLLGGWAEALTAGTGTVSATWELLGSHTVSISATFDSAIYDLGVNLGPVGTVSAASVVLTNRNIFTGASFVVPFAHASNSFDAVGDIACPSGGCLVPASGPYAFVGFLQNVNVGLLSAFPTYTFTFDGSTTCSSDSGGVFTCNGTFVLNAFPPDAVGTGAQVTIDDTLSFRDPVAGALPDLNTRVILSNVTTAGNLSVARLARYRGALPANVATTGGGFDAIYFDVATDAVFGSVRVCVEVDSNRDGVVDGTTLAVNQLAILHAAVRGDPFVAVPLVVVPPFICADGLTSLSPFVLLIDTSVPGPTTTTTTTTSPSTSTVTTTTAIGATTTTTLASACATARDCLREATARPLCAEPINPKLQKTITKEVKVATTKLGKAAVASGAKAAKFQKQARAAIVAIDTQADKFVTKKKGPISSACRDAIKQAFGPVLGAIDASRI